MKEYELLIERLIKYSKILYDYCQNYSSDNVDIKFILPLVEAITQDLNKLSEQKEEKA